MAADNPRREPGRFFSQRGVTTVAQLDAARALGGDLVERLLEAESIEDRHAAQFRAFQRGIGYVNLDQVRINVAATLSLPSDLAREIGTLPLKLDGRTLYVAFRDPCDRAAIRRAEEASGCRVVPVAAAPRALEAALRRSY